MSDRRRLRPLAALRRFRRRENGSLLIFGLFLFATFFLMSGLAVDLMRIENRRAWLSNTLDRCTLNAAALRQTLDPATVVRDCMNREGLLPHLTNVTVTSAGVTRSVEARGDINLRTLFIDSAGVPNVNAGARSRAAQGAGNVEIVLALDVSGSMSSGGRMAALRTAAQNFVTTVLSNTSGNVSVAIVPYNGQVNLGPALASKFNITHRSGLGVTVNGDMSTGNCVDFPPETFTSTGIPRSLPLPSSGWFDGNTGDTSVNSTVNGQIMRPLASNVFCRLSTRNIIRLHDNNITNLHTYINNLVPDGGTAINLGMKWAAALVDPQARSIINEFVADGTIPAVFRDRPGNFMTNTSMKVIVLMTDGENAFDVRLRDPYRVGPSPIFLGTDGFLSIRHTTGRPPAAGSNEFWVPQRDPDGNASNGVQGEWRATAWGGTPTTLGRQLTWQEVWQLTTPGWVAWQMYARALALTTNDMPGISATWRNNFRQRRGAVTTAPDLDNELSQICTATKQQGVLIYGVAFSTSTQGINTIRNCASSALHFFDSTNSTALNAAFQSIATNITTLRLVN